MMPFPDRLYRGESRSISSIIEDVIAYAVITQLPKKCKILINQPMRFNGVSIKPDLAVVKGDEVIQLCDIKMDLGYKRDSFIGWLRDWSPRMKAVRSHTTKIKIKDNGEYIQEMKILRMSETALFNVFVVSGTNIRKEALRLIEKQAKTIDCCRLFVFSTGVHPNVYGIPEDELLMRFPVDPTVYQKFIESLKK